MEEKKDNFFSNPDFEEWAQKLVEKKSHVEVTKGEEATSLKKGLSLKPEGEEAQKLETATAETTTETIAEETDVLKALAEQAGFEFVSLKDFKLKSEKILELVPGDIARTYRVFPLEIESDGTLVIAISDPLNVHLLDDLQLLLNHPIRAVVASEQEINDLIELYYKMTDETLTNIIKDMESKRELKLTETNEFNIGDMESIANSPTIIKLVDLILLQAIKDRASDVHIEPTEDKVRIRYRVDGVLRELPPPPKHLHLGIISRIKIMANMDIAETRKPQDGRIKLNVQGKEIDLRVATLPTIRGEGVAMRILDKSVMMMGLEQVGMHPDVLEKFDKIIHRPNGIILITGPTGCGKTTTMYAAFSRVNSPEEKLITTEDPVEYELPGVIQVNINPKVGLTFASCLRAILRQDPDKIMVGEIRDFETAQMAVQASLTEHLVFSTLHTNSAAGTITRFMDMGVEPFLITSSLQCVLSQRLVRTICPVCKEPYQPTDEELAQFGKTRRDVEGITFYHGVGCEDCAHTGYKGRIGVFELLEVTEPIRELILERASADEIHQAARKLGMQTMREDGWTKIVAGITTFEEVILHTPEDQEDKTTVELEEIIKKAEKKFERETIEIKKEPLPQEGEEAIQAYKVGDAESLKK